MTFRRLVIISPHFDDGVGSCSGLILRLTRGGVPVTVCTVMSRGTWLSLLKGFVLWPADWRPGSPVWHRAREDYRACRLLGAGRFELGLREAGSRRDERGEYLYRGKGRDLFGNIRREDVPFAADAEHRVIEWCRGQPNTIFAFPQGVGHHIDHQILSAAGQKWLGDGGAVVFYRDFFYREHARAMDPLERGWRHLPIDLAADELDLKWRALQLYRSQLPVLYGSWQRARETVQQFEAREDYYVPNELGQLAGIEPLLGALGDLASSHEQVIL